MFPREPVANSYFFQGAVFRLQQPDGVRMTSPTAPLQIDHVIEIWESIWRGMFEVNVGTQRDHTQNQDRTGQRSCWG